MQHLRNEAIADALDLVRPPRATREDIALGRFGGKDFDSRVLLFEILASASHGTSCALRQDQGANFAFALLPDLRTRGAIMGLDVIDIDELTDLPVFARSSRLERLDLLDNQIDVALGAGCEHKFRAIRAD